MWSFPSFWARVGPLGGVLLERSRKSVARKCQFPERGPWAWDWGEREGTMLWIAFREACSPVCVLARATLAWRITVTETDGCR